MYCGLFFHYRAATAHGFVPVDHEGWWCGSILFWDQHLLVFLIKISTKEKRLTSSRYHQD